VALTVNGWTKVQRGGIGNGEDKLSTRIKANKYGGENE
jgi:hypothetical protein